MSSRRLLVAVAAAALVALSPGVGTVRADHCATLLASPTGSAIDGRVPSGRGEWRGNLICSTALELKFEVRDVNLSDGTLVTFDSCGFQKDLTLSGGAARFELKRSNGDFVPLCSRDTGVRVLHGATPILSGVWCAPRVRPCP